MARCKSCGAPIIWIKTAAGKAMPANPERLIYWERPGAAGKVITQDGRVKSCDFDGEPGKATGVGYVSHFSTCPNAAIHRRK